MQSATCPPLTLPWAPLSLVPSGNCVSRFRSAWILYPRDPQWPDGQPPVRTFPNGSDHCHASQEWTVLIASHCFRVFDTNVPMSTEFPIPQIPTLQFADSWPLMMALSSLFDVRTAGPHSSGFSPWIFPTSCSQNSRLPTLSRSPPRVSP
jgi:hypothetical protein